MPPNHPNMYPKFKYTLVQLSERGPAIGSVAQGELIS